MEPLKAIHDSFLFEDDLVPEWGRNNPERAVCRYGAEQLPLSYNVVWYWLRGLVHVACEPTSDRELGRLSMDKRSLKLYKFFFQTRFELGPTRC